MRKSESLGGVAVHLQPSVLEEAPEGLGPPEGA